VKSKIHPRDAKLLISLLLTSIIAIAGCVFGSRQFERYLLIVEVEEMAVHWVTFLKRNFSDFDGILRSRSVSPADQTLLDFASEAGRLVRYKMFNRDGVVVYASRSSDLGQRNLKPYFAEIVQKGGTFVKIEEEDEFGPTRTTVSEVYVPFMENGEFKGAVKVYVDVTAFAQTLRQKSTQALLAVVAFLLTLGGGCGVFIVQNIRDRNHDLREVMEAHEAASQAEAKVKALNAELEERVAERTDELKVANQRITKLNEDLEQRVIVRTAELKSAQEGLLRAERLSALGQVTATVAHELRNPLGAIRNSVFLIGEKTQDKGLDLERMLARTERNISRCDRIVNELLDYTRAKSLKPKPAPLDAWLEDVLAEQTVPEGITLYKELGTPELELAFDADHLRRAVINVFDNACQAMAEWGKKEPDRDALSLTVQTRSSGGRAELRFIDTGPGMTPEVLEKAFEPLFSTKGFGVGLGMPTIKQIMEQHGGGMEVLSEPGHGTTVVLWLPVENLQEEAA